MSYVNITSKLFEIMETVRDDSNLAVVFNYDPWFTDESGFPYSCIVTNTATEESLDSCNNQTLYQFLIRTIDATKSKVITETVLRTICDRFLTELRKRENITLGGVVDRLLPFEVTWWWDTSNQTPMRYFEISITALCHNSIL